MALGRREKGKGELDGEKRREEKREIHEKEEREIEGGGKEERLAQKKTIRC